MKHNKKHRLARVPILFGGAIAILTLVVLFSIFHNEMAAVTASLIDSFVNVGGITP